MKKFLTLFATSFFLSLYLFSGVIHAVSPAPLINDFSCKATNLASMSPATMVVTVQANNDVFEQNNFDFSSIKAAVISSQNSTSTPSSFSDLSSSSPNVESYTFTNLNPSDIYNVQLTLPDGSQDTIPACGFSVNPVATTNNPNGTCSASNITNDQCYTQVCSGQASEDSAACNSYATNWNQMHNSSEPQCNSIDSSDETQCCPSGADGSPMCSAYANYTDDDADNESQACTTIDNDVTYEHCCTGQASEDSTVCQQYATADATAAGDPECASITDGTNGNEQQCCEGDESTDSPMCIAFDNYTDGDAADESGVPGQIGSGTPLSTNPINSGGVTSDGTDASNNVPANAAIASCSAIQFSNLLNIAAWVKCVIGVIIIPGIFMLAFVVFLWGVFKFIRASEQKDKDEGKQFIYMGLIGLFIMVSVWGIIKIATNTFGLDSTVPTLQTEYINPSSTTTTPTTTTPSSVSTGAAN